MNFKEQEQDNVINGKEYSISKYKQNSIILIMSKYKQN